MTTSSHLRPFIVCALLLGAVASQAFAATTIVNITSNKSSLSTADWANGTLDIPKFNATLGTLTKVAIYLESNISTTINIKNDSGTNAGGWAATVLDVNVTGAIAQAPFLTITADRFNFSDLAPGDSISSGALAGYNNQTRNYTTSDQLNAFKGAGNVQLGDWTLTGVSSLITGGTVTTGQVTNADLNGTVTYTYNIPEPACLGVLAAGLCLTWRRRRQ